MNDKDHEQQPKRADAWKKDMILKGVVDDIALRIFSGEINNSEHLQEIKIKASRSTGIGSIPSNSTILDYIRVNYPDREGEVLPLLMKKPSRTLSGVAVVAAMTSPHECPHGRCLFCPGGVDQGVPTPQSYTGKEPAAMRAAQNDYDPFRQVRRRIEQLTMTGHPTDKIDLIIMGGTMTARSPQYQKMFVKGCLDGMNGSIGSTFEESSFINETADHRCIGMTLETRPDWFREKEIDLSLGMGCTRVELGVQSAFDGPLEISRRGHGVRESIEATRMAKDSGLKVGYHLMPGLPGSNYEMDLESARRIFEESDLRPDMIKIYPTLVIEGTELYKMWRKGEYEPLSTEEAARLVADIKRITPPWIRIQRVQRDIPSPLVAGGVKKSNLRQLAMEIMRVNGWSCRCIRCREVGHKIGPGEYLPPPEDVSLVRRSYRASRGNEIFLSFEVEEKDALVGHLRLRLPSEMAHRNEVNGAGIVRELKVFGPMVPLGERVANEWQHRGYGKKLLETAESIVKDEWGLDRIIVTSGIGAREYYRRSGFERMGPYMGKDL